MLYKMRPAKSLSVKADTESLFLVFTYKISAGKESVAPRNQSVASGFLSIDMSLEGADFFVGKITPPAPLSLRGGRKV